MRALKFALLLVALPCPTWSAEAPLVQAAAVLVYSTPDATNLKLTPEGAVRFSGPVPGTESELVPGRACAFQSRSLPDGRPLFQVNLAGAERAYTIGPSRFAHATIRLVGAGIYCDKNSAGEPSCRNVYDVTAWGELDLRNKIGSLRRLAEGGCFR